ncbi:MAG: WG repeat-containing protein [Bacteroidetes bacterium]|nr:WG repeat-containing protein [Bacteroidota bacterium]
MKSTLQLFAIFLAVSFLSSCGGDGKSVSEVKLIPVKSGNDFQYIDKEGKIVINPQFSEATIFRNGLALVRTSGDEPKWGFISEDGKFAITANYKSATVFSDDLAWVVSENAPPTAINSKGEIKVTLQDAETVKIYKEGLSAFSIAERGGLEPSVL